MPQQDVHLPPSPVPPHGMQFQKGQTDRRQVVSVIGPSGQMYTGTVCCYLRPSHRIRLIFIWIVEQWWFSQITLTAIIANSAVLAIQGPPGNPNSPIPDAYAPALELGFTLLFTAEMIVKIMAMGFIWHRTRNKPRTRQLSRALPISSATPSRLTPRLSPVLCQVARTSATCGIG